MALCRLLRQCNAPGLRTSAIYTSSSLSRQCTTGSSITSGSAKSCDSGTDSDPEKLFEGVCKGDRASLGRAITLVESSHPESRQRSKRLLELATAHIKRTRPRLQDRAYRVALTGPPGVGKSSFIESFGMYLLEKKLPHSQEQPEGGQAAAEAEAKAEQLECSRLAVLCIDPSSAVTGGSILGDRTRMQYLAQHDRAYIRPSPSGTRLGGVARCTAECMTLCECAGYELLLVETVGVGQSECAAVNLVDAFVCVVQPGSGDEVQALKRGVIELADLVAVNKFDGELTSAARRTAAAYSSALKVIRGRSETWRPVVVKISALTGSGFQQLSAQLRLFRQVELASGELAARRAQQRVELFRNELRERVFEMAHRSERLRVRLNELEAAVRDESALAGFAADTLLDAVFSNTAFAAN